MDQITCFAPLFLIAWLAGAQPPGRSTDTKLTSPPGPDTPEIAEQLAPVREALAAGKADVTTVLTDQAWLPLHERPSFRSLIRTYARSSRIAIVTPQEPGDRLVVTGTVMEPGGKPAGGALVYLYQTSAKGWYSDRAAHYAAQSGDERHARLFGYLKTDGEGRFELSTIRPGGYPQSTLPQHIHIEVFVAGSARLVSEIQFSDDPRLTPEQRRRSTAEGFLIVPVQREANGSQRCTVDVNLRKPHA
jgi:protocatechuate 3,4-dioxygenase beta subunit